MRTAARLGDNPHIVTLHDVGEHDGITFLVSQLVRGGSVADWLRQVAPAGLPLTAAVRIAREVSGALAHAHDQDVVHRDVKPSNILLADDGSALLTDFGVALLTDRARVTAEGTVIGSAAYMPPEQALGRAVDKRGDLYSLGATLYEMVCGRPLFSGAQLAVLSQHVRRRPPDPRSVNPDVPDRLATLILRLVAKQPEDRPGSALEVEQALAEVSAYRTAADPTTRPVSLPRQLAGPAERPFVDREPAMEALRSGWGRAAEGRPSLRLITGEPGIGKTRIAAAFADEVQAKSALVLYGRCDEDPLISYQPFVETLRQLISHDPGLDAALDPRLEPELVELGRLVPELRRTAPPGETPATGGSERYLLFETIVALLMAAAITRPLLLVLDDLHWADKPTVLLLRQLLRAPAGKAMVLATSRPEGLDSEQPLAAVIADLHRESDVNRLGHVKLGGLDEAHTGVLVTTREKRQLDDEFVSLLHGETAGNPFFIEEAMRALQDADLSTAAGAARALRSVGVPAGAKEVIQRRLSRLSPEAVELLTSASVCGREFRLGVVAELMGLPVARLLGLLDEVIAAGLVAEPIVDRFSFCHALVREALYVGIASDTHRARLHLAVGEALEKLGEGVAPPSELALHFHAARAVGGAERAVVYARAAAEAAASALSYEEAAVHTTRELDALEVLGPGHDRERGGLLHALGRLQWQAGDRASAQATFLREAELARELGDSNQLARAALGFGGLYYDAEHTDEVLIGLIEEALAALPPGDGAVRSELMARLAHALHFTDPEGRAVGLSADAVDMARRTGERAAMLAVLGARHAILLHAAHVGQRLALAREWLQLAEDAGHRHEKALALNWYIYDLVESGDGDGARRAHRELVELAEQLRQPQYRNFATSWEFVWLHLAGRFAEAERKAVETYRYARRAQGTYAKHLFAGQLFAVRRDQGRLGEIADVVAPLVGEFPTLSPWRAAMVVAHVAEGNLERARSELSVLARDDFSSIPMDAFWLGAMCIAAEGCAALADAGSAERLVRQLEPYADLNVQVGLAFCLGPVHRFLGSMRSLLGDFTDAEQHFVASMERSRTLGAVTTEALAQCEYGELLLRFGKAGAREQLEQARETAERLGMASLLMRATAALERAPIAT
jgi:tetratricopeptide (TPR) repeat protein